MKCFLCCLFHCFTVLILQAQKDSTYYDFGDFGGIIHLDSVVVTASRNDLDIHDFIELIRSDRSFYQAFNNIRTLSYSADNEISMFKKNGKVKAYYRNRIRQTSDGKCRTMAIREEKVSGNFFKKKKKLRYYTARLFDRLFFTHGKVCGSEPGPGEKATDLPENAGAGGMEKHVRELKKLIFSPGEPTEVPMIGKKTAIFSEKMIPYYDLSISSKMYKDRTECYVFTAKVKPEYQKNKKGKTVIKFLETYFEKSTFQVLARKYALEYSGLLFDFNVDMQIELKSIKGHYVPEYLAYDGFWDIPTRRPEISKFHARFYDYSIQED